MISLQTNVDSLNAQRNLGIDNTFESKTIQQLTSGYRINSSGDDAAGLAIANGYASTISQLNQGVLNANDGTSQLQIVDGGLSNISSILNRLQTLATQSASAAFTGSRVTLNQEYSQDVAEITRQASNIGLNNGGNLNSLLSIFIGGGNNAANGTVSVNLSGSANAVDATSLGLATTNILGSGAAGFQGNTQRLDAPNAKFLQSSNPPLSTDNQTFNFNYYSNGSAQSLTVTVAATGNGSSIGDILASINGQLNNQSVQTGITASVGTDGTLKFSGNNAFNVQDVPPTTPTTGSTFLTNEVTAGQTTDNTGLYNTDGGAYTATAAAATTTQNLTIVTGTGSSAVSTVITLPAATASSTNAQDITSAITAINAKTSSLGVFAVLNAAGTGISLQSANSFSVEDTGSTASSGFSAIAPTPATPPPTTDYGITGTAYTGAAQTLTITPTKTGSTPTAIALLAGDTLTDAITKINAKTATTGVTATVNAAGTGLQLDSTSGYTVFGSAANTIGISGLTATPQAAVGTALASTATANAQAAITAIGAAITALGLVQGSVGAGENKLTYANQLAQSQISSFSTAESQIRDADVAAQAANLSKSQVLTQTAVAALAQANSEPQALLKLLQ